MLEKLSSGLKNAMKKLMQSRFATEKLINEAIREIQRALIQSDVNIRLVLNLTNEIKKEAKKISINGLTKREEIIKIVYDKLVEFLGNGYDIEIKKTPFRIMLVGLFGNGKTTTSAKLAKFYLKQGYKVALLQTDTYRPAAYEQLLQLGNQIHVKVFGNTHEKDPVKIYKQFESELKKFDVVIIDTAGRDALNQELIDEIHTLYDVISPEEVFLVMSADIGQGAEKLAKAFYEATHITGVIITRLDGSGKGGGALTACAVANVNVKFIGTGEKIDDLEKFDPVRFVSRMLGLGDLQTLLEKAQEAIDEEQATDLVERFMKGDFTLIDLYEQMKAMKKLGPINKVINMIPGLSMNDLPKELLSREEKKLDLWKVAMQSMTREELQHPEIINSSRLERISRGSGVDKNIIEDLLKTYRQMKKFLKLFKGKKGNMRKIMRKYKNLPINQLMEQMSNMNFNLDM